MTVNIWLPLANSQEGVLAADRRATNTNLGRTRNTARFSRKTRKSSKRKIAMYGPNIAIAGAGDYPSFVSFAYNVIEQGHEDPLDLYLNFIRRVRKWFNTKRRKKSINFTTVFVNLPGENGIRVMRSWTGLSDRLYVEPQDQPYATGAGASFAIQELGKRRWDSHCTLDQTTIAAHNALEAAEKILAAKEKIFFKLAIEE